MSIVAFALMLVLGLCLIFFSQAFAYNAAKSHRWPGVWTAVLTGFLGALVCLGSGIFAVAVVAS